MIKETDIRKLVDDIHSAEAAHKNRAWTEWCSERGYGLPGLPARSYPDIVTGLYTLRAQTRGRCHRKNPPAPIRDYNRSMEMNGSKDRMTWDMEKHNQQLAEKFAPHYKKAEDSQDSPAFEHVQDHAVG